MEYNQLYEFIGMNVDELLSAITNSRFILADAETAEYDGENIHVGVIQLEDNVKIAIYYNILSNIITDIIPHT